MTIVRLKFTFWNDVVKWGGGGYAGSLGSLFDSRTFSGIGCRFNTRYEIATKYEILVQLHRTKAKR
jgi:hypothetical protein